MATADKVCDERLTGPEVAARLNLPLDRFRKLLRRRPDLAGLFEQVGPTRVLPASKVAALRAGLSEGRA
jgi:hypothetical protein